MYGNQFLYNQNRYQPVQPINNNYIPQAPPLLGKSVDSVDSAKYADIPLDGSVNYFPLVDGSAIVTKQLQQDGTSKITIYEPKTEKETIKFATIDDIDKRLEKIDFSEIDDLKEELSDLKKELKEIKSKLKTKKED